MKTDVLQVPELNSKRSLELQKAKLDRGFYNLIGGERSSSGGTLPVIDPSNGETLATVPDIDREGFERAVSAAQKAFPAWRKMPFNDRRAMLIAVLNRIEQHVGELSSLLTAEQGRPQAGAKWEMEWMTKRYGDAFRRMDLPEEESDVEGVGHVVKRYVPLGVVCAISPWNLPVLLSFVKVLPALLTGNTVVLKPSPFTPLTILRIADYVRELLPPGVLNVITGSDNLGPWMTSHAGFSKITFTGSTQTGKRILESAASTLKHVTLELGGNDAGIVLPDADPEKIATALFWSMFMLSGQGCITLKRLYVHEDVYTAFATALIACARNTKTGDAFAPDSALGPIQNRPQYERLQSTLKAIDNSGARILYQGQIPHGSRGFFVPVTILDNPPDDAEFVKNEVFGPIRSMFKYKDIEEAIRRANASPYGLGASVWGENPEQLDAVARRLEAGTVWINQHLNPHPDLPFSGFKESGFGVEFGREGLQAFCNIQIIARK